MSSLAVKSSRDNQFAPSRTYVHTRWDECQDTNGNFVFVKDAEYTRQDVYHKRFCAYLHDGAFRCASPLQQDDRQMCKGHNQDWLSRRQRQRPHHVDEQSEQKTAERQRPRNYRNYRDEQGRLHTEQVPAGVLISNLRAQLAALRQTCSQLQIERDCYHSQIKMLLDKLQTNDIYAALPQMAVTAAVASATVDAVEQVEDDGCCFLDEQEM